jgi:hypothetical protein
MPAYYARSIEDFLEDTVESVELSLIRAYERDKYKDLITTAITVWRSEINVMRACLTNPKLGPYTTARWGIAFEFTTPRKNGRIDVVLTIGGSIVALEFKTTYADSAAASQIEDYCLDLIQFHSSSHQRTVFPLVLATQAEAVPNPRAVARDGLEPVRFCTRSELVDCLVEIAEKQKASEQIDIRLWNDGEYKPVPTIVEAAISMFATMEVQDIAHADADAENLTTTVNAARQIVEAARGAKEKVVCFVTGVPGAGKTLAGLSLVHDMQLRKSIDSDVVFITGNLPLVKVLQSALSRDKAARLEQSLRVSSRDPKTTIDTVLSYKKAALANKRPPHENVIVFDEAQRAWTSEKTQEYLDPSDTEWIGYSEPELIMGVLDRHEWAAIIALVGGGQEIHDGEAGLGEWGRALENRFKHWKVAAATEALEGHYGAGARLFKEKSDRSVNVNESLHLDNPIRQFRGKTVALWAEHVINGQADKCAPLLKRGTDYPVVLARDLSTAKCWLKDVARGRERFGLIGSSGAKRLRAEGIELPGARADGVEHWFLNRKGDVRSSFQMETAATEFQIQGLELDWSCICWGGDFLRGIGDWLLKRFVGTKWQEVRQNLEREYIVNKYRVLLTRSRKGMVLFLPRGNRLDSTTRPEDFDRTAEYLIGCGVQELT